jgi:hypothetical protein
MSKTETFTEWMPGHVAAIANAVVAAQDHDHFESAFGLIMIATILVGDDPVSRTSLARWMLETAHELDPDVTCAPRLS